MVGIEEFKQVLGSFPSGVTITACYDQYGHVQGMTASAFCSVSLEPTLVLMCPSKKADCHNALVAADSFSINILKQEQTELAWRFASKNTDKVNNLDIKKSPGGAPIFEGCLAFIECRQFACYDGGDHSILVGQVEYCEPPKDGDNPLVYCFGKLGGLNSV